MENTTKPISIELPVNDKIIQFKTASRTVYILDGLKLKRLSEKPMLDIRTGKRTADMPEFEEVIFFVPPTIGLSFEYIHPRLDGCISTPVTEIVYLEHE